VNLSAIERLLETLVKLRGPTGCAWDQRQDLASAARFLADEVFEYVDVAQRGDDEAATEELADLFYMLAFNWLLLHERNGLEFEELARRGDAKLRRRKPHVFEPGSEWDGLEADEIWRRTKSREQGDEGPPPSLLKDLHPSASPLRQALLHGQLAARADFDWPSPDPVFEKVREEIDELREAIANNDRPNIEEEVGDLLFAVVQLGRKLDVDPDLALARTNVKFARRFRTMEARYDYDASRLRALGIEGLWREYDRAKRELAHDDDAGPSSGHPSSSSKPS
jgi:nucleoside triphosphate diphosphatase